MGHDFTRRDAIGHREDAESEIVGLGELTLRERQAEQEDLLGNESAVAQDADETKLVGSEVPQVMCPQLAAPDGVDSRAGNLQETAQAINCEIPQLHPAFLLARDQPCRQQSM